MRCGEGEMSENVREGVKKSISCGHDPPPVWQKPFFDFDILLNSYFYVSEHSASISPLRKKNKRIVADSGLTTTPPVYGHVCITNRFFDAFS